MECMVNVHLDRDDRVGEVRVTPLDAVVVAQVLVGSVRLVGSPRLLRRVAQELLDAADVACRREDAMSDTPLFEGVQ